MAKQFIQFSTKIGESHKKKVDQIKAATGLPICRMVENWIDRAFREIRDSRKSRSGPTDKR